MHLIFVQCSVKEHFYYVVSFILSPSSLKYWGHLDEIKICYCIYDNAKQIYKRAFDCNLYNANDEDVKLDENHIAMIGDCMIEWMGHNNQGPRFYFLMHQGSSWKKKEKNNLLEPKLHQWNSWKKKKKIVLSQPWKWRTWIVRYAV